MDEEKEVFTTIGERRVGLKRGGGESVANPTKEELLTRLNAALEAQAKVLDRMRKQLLGPNPGQPALQLYEEREDLRCKLIEKEAVLEEVRRLRDVARKDRDQYRHHLTARTAELAARQANVDRLVSELDQSKQVLRDVIAERDQARRHIEILTSNRSDLIDKLEISETQLKEAVEALRVKAGESVLEEVLAIERKVIAGQAAEIDRLREKLTTETSVIIRKNNEVERLQGELGERIEQVKSQLKVIAQEKDVAAKLRGDLERSRAHSARQREVIDSLGVDLRRMKEEKEAANLQVIELREVADSLSLDLRRMKEEMDRLKVERDQAKANGSIPHLLEQLVKAEGQREHLRDNLASASRMSQHWQEELAREKKVTKELREENDRFQVELANLPNLQARLKGQQEESRRLRENLDVAKTDNGVRADVEFQRLRQSLAQEKRVNQELRDLIQGVKNDLSDY